MPQNSNVAPAKTVDTKSPVWSDCGHRAARFGLLVFVLVAGTYATLPKPFLSPDLRIGRLIAPITIGVTALFAVLNYITGVSVVSLMRKLELWVAKRTDALLADVF